MNHPRASSIRFRSRPAPAQPRARRKAPNDAAKSPREGEVDWPGSRRELEAFLRAEGVDQEIFAEIPKGNLPLYAALHSRWLRAPLAAARAASAIPPPPPAPPAPAPRAASAVPPPAAAPHPVGAMPLADAPHGGASRI